MAKLSKTMAEVFADPVRANIRWQAIEAMLIALGAETEEGSGSRIRFQLNGVAATFHRPHPRKQASRPVVRGIRRFLTNAGFQP